jgi:hypothetical protein
MKRYLADGLLVVAVLAVGLVIYRTAEPQAGPATELTSGASFGGVSLRIDYATTTEVRELGLGGRTSVPEGYGMLFAFPSDDYYGFWMKDMLVPIDIFWLDSKGQVVYMTEDVSPSSYPSVFYPTEPARYVLETTAGFARANSIATGTPLLLKNFPTVLK